MFRRRRIVQLIVGLVVFVCYIQFQLFTFTERRLFLKRVQLALPHLSGSSERPFGEACLRFKTAASSPNREGNGGLTLMTWTSRYIADLRSFIEYPMFPKYPVTLQFNMKSSFRIHFTNSTGGWLFGSLLVPETGHYRFAVSSSGEALLRLSRDDAPDKIRLIASIPFSPVEQQPVMGQYNKHSSQTSVSIFLKQCGSYFIEVLFYNLQKDGHVEIAWETPQSLRYVVIPSLFLSPYIMPRDIAHSGKSLLIFEDTVKMNTLLGRFVHEKHSIEKEQLDDWDRLPFMSSQHALYTSPKCSSNFRGSWSNPHLEIPKTNSKNALRMVDQYTGRLVKESKGKYSFKGLHHSEEKTLGDKGIRYLFNLEFKDNMMDMKVRVSEYLFYENSKMELCVIDSFKWSRNAMVTFVAVVRKKESWSHQFMDQLSEMTKQLRDARFSIIILSSNNMKEYIQAIVSRNTLSWHSHFTLLLLNEKRLKSIEYVMQVAIQHIKDPNSIICFTDIRVQIPTKILEHIRKRTIQGQTLFVPWPENFNKGFHENATIISPLDRSTAHPPSFAMYVSDWKQLNDQKSVGRRKASSVRRGSWWHTVAHGALELYVSRIPHLLYFPKGRREIQAQDS